MPILGLVLSWEHGTPGAMRASTISILEARSDIEVGATSDLKLPVVLECEHESEVEGRVAALRDLPGVDFVDVVFAEFADLLPDDDATRRPELDTNEMESKAWT